MEKHIMLELYNVANLDHNYIMALKMNSKHVIGHQIGMLF
jgi:hypothetical protein